MESARYGGRDVTDGGLRIDGVPPGPLVLVLGGPQSVATIRPGFGRDKSSCSSLATIAVFDGPGLKIVDNDWIDGLDHASLQSRPSCGLSNAAIITPAALLLT
jgi:hypothetical protein